MIRKIYQIVIIILPLMSSCLNRQFIDGKSEFKGVSDTVVNDSSIISGNVYLVDGINNIYIPGEYKVWIQETNLTAETDTAGHYTLKTIPGTYNLKCERQGNEWQRLIESITVTVGANQKAKIDFYIGYTIE